MACPVPSLALKFFHQGWEFSRSPLQSFLLSQLAFLALERDQLFLHRRHEAVALRLGQLFGHITHPVFALTAADCRRRRTKTTKQQQSRLRPTSRATNSRGSVSSRSVLPWLDSKPAVAALVDLDQHLACLGRSQWRVIPNYWRGIAAKAYCQKAGQLARSD